MNVMDRIHREDCEAAGVVKEFDRLVKLGNNSSFAAMLALKSPPAYSGSERAILEGDVRHHGLQDLPLFMQRHMIAEAKRAGIPIEGKIYKGKLADQRGAADPLAWVGGIDDVIHACKVKRKNLEIGGRPAVTHEEAPPPPPCPLSEQAFLSIAPEYLHHNPDFKGDIHDLKDAVTERHGAPARKQKRKLKYDEGPDLD